MRFTGPYHTTWASCFPLERNQLTSDQENYQTYNFSNIRYAQPPLGNLRFNHPVSPVGRDSVVQNGTEARICPQASPDWILIARQYTAALASGSPFNYTKAVEAAQKQISAGGSRPLDPRTSEDCLFLDVVVSKPVFDQREQVCNRRSSGAPIIVWIYGGGYTAGYKDLYGSPNGLINASRADGSDGVVYMAMNYRLGALGWLGGPTLQESGGVSNAGLLDQKLALEWIAKYAPLFGGNPNNITVIGESAGGGSIMHHVTSYGGQGKVNFQQAIPQSPGYFPLVRPAVQEETAQEFFRYANVSNLAEARNLSSEAIIAANLAQVRASPYSQFTYGPVVDGDYVPDLPGVLLNNGQYHRHINLLLGHNHNEGSLFTPPNITTDADVASFMRKQLPYARQEVVDYVVNNLYPPLYNDTSSIMTTEPPSSDDTDTTISPTSLHYYPYTTPLERATVIISEWIFTCNTNYLSRAANYLTHNYEFQLPPASHGQDVAHTFSTGHEPTNLTLGFHRFVANVLQGYITNFAKGGDPNGYGYGLSVQGQRQLLLPLPWFPVQGFNASLNGLNDTGVKVQMDNTVNRRCAWWQQDFYN